MNKIHLKRLNRKQQLEHRVRCHGNKLKCSYAHPGNFIQGYKEEIRTEKKEEKPWWKKVINGFYKKI